MTSRFAAVPLSAAAASGLRTNIRPKLLWHTSIKTVAARSLREWEGAAHSIPPMEGRAPASASNFADDNRNPSCSSYLTISQPALLFPLCGGPALSDIANFFAKVEAIFDIAKPEGLFDARTAGRDVSPLTAWKSLAV